MSTNHIRRWGPMVVLATALALTGCAESKDDAAPAAAQDDPGVAFAQCLREQGVQVADPDPGQPVLIDQSVDPTAFQEASEACRDLMPQGGPGGGGPGAFPDIDEMVALTTCMREKGIEGLPDPQQGAGGQITQGLGGVDPGDPEVVAAREACAEELGVDLPGASR